MIFRLRLLSICVINSRAHAIFKCVKNGLILQFDKQYLFYPMKTVANFKKFWWILTFRTAFFSNGRFYENPLSREPKFGSTISHLIWIQNITLINLRAPFGYLSSTVLNIFWKNRKKCLRRRPIFLEYRSQIAIF